MVQAIIDAVSSLPAALAVFVVAAIPISELRGAIPLGILVFDMHPVVTAIIAIMGNMVLIPVCLWIAQPTISWLTKHSKLADRILSGLFSRTRKKVGPKLRRYQDVGLMLFVAIPLPFTGAYSGALAAFLFGIPARRAVPLIGAGVVIAAVVVTLVVVLGLGIAGLVTS